jgi:5-methylthioadenosine/S-adenosylhomocysteine deaminase
MDMAAKLHKVHTLDPTILDAHSVLRMATIEGARALGLDRQTGSLEKGKRADIIIIDTRCPHLTPMYDPCSHLVYAAKGSDVVTSIVDGKVLMENRELSTLMLDPILRDVRGIAEEIAQGVQAPGAK